MRIRRTFNLSATLLGDSDKNSFWVITVLPVAYKRTRTISDQDQMFTMLTYEKRQVTGALFNARYTKHTKRHSWWCELTTACAKEHACSRGALEFNVCRRGFDDIVVTTGVARHFTKNTQCVLYALAGFPTREQVTPLEVHDTFLGTRFFGVGVGLELSHAFINTLKQSCIGVIQTRILHFFKRQWYPILPADALIKPGDVVDLLLALNYRRRKNIFEVGYNPTWFLHSAVLLPTGPVVGKEYRRQGVYASFNHIFLQFPVLNKPAIVGAGVNTTWTQHFDTRINSYWLNLSIIF